MLRTFFDINGRLKVEKYFYVYEGGDTYFEPQMGRDSEYIGYFRTEKFADEKPVENDAYKLYEDAEYKFNSLYEPFIGKPEKKEKVFDVNEYYRSLGVGIETK